MCKVFIVKKITNEQPLRRCKNCGVDITNKRKDAEFCCPICRISYNNDGKFKSRYYN